MNTNQFNMFLKINMLVLGLTLITLSSLGQHVNTLNAKVNTPVINQTSSTSIQEGNFDLISQAITGDISSNQQEISDPTSFSVLSTEITLQENETGFCAVDGIIETEHSGYTGDGYANTDNASGTGIDYKINVVAAGTYTIEIRYAATSDRPANLLLNGSVVTSGIAMPSSGAWTTWSTTTTTAYLSAGISDLRLEATTSSGLANIDYLKFSGSDINAYDCSGGTNPETYTISTSVSPSNGGIVTLSPSGGTYDAGTTVTLTATPSSGYQFSFWSGSVSGTNQTTSVTVNSNLSVTANFTEIITSSEVTLQENETGFCSVDGLIESEHTGYTGDGYANTDNSSGTGIDYKINVGTAGTYTVEIRYAASGDRPANLIQNGSVVTSISLPSSGAWTTWYIATTTAYLSAGISDLRLEATSSSGLPNIDYLKLSGSSIAAEDCSGGSTGPYSVNVSVNPSNAGYVSLSPSGGTYDAGTVVTLTAVAYTDYAFSSWSGATGSATTTVTVNSDLDITANFVYTGSGGDDADFALIGYATQNGGTTGGSGGTVVYASTGDQILGYIDEKKDGAYANGLIIVVNGTITPSNTSATKIDVKEVRDVSVVGSGTSGEFNGIGIKVYRAGNVILRNLKIHHVDIGDKDCIGIEGPADHVWVDHCELYNEYGDNVDKDYYDGLLDAKAESEYITYSWNYLHDSWKTMLVGSGDTDDFDRKITMHHNIFENCNSRMPLYRFGTGHVFNNYYVDGESTAINSRMGACLRIENNYFENVINPYVTAYSSEDGYGDLINNILDNCSFSYSSDVRELPSCNSSVPYSYQDVLNSASSVPTITRQNAGVGKLSNPINYTVKSANEASFTQNISAVNNFHVYPNPSTGKTTIAFSLTSNKNLSFKVFDMTGRCLDLISEDYFVSGSYELNYENPELNPGIYILTIQDGNNIKNIRLIKN